MRALRPRLGATLFAIAFFGSGCDRSDDAANSSEAVGAPLDDASAFHYPLGATVEDRKKAPLLQQAFMNDNAGWANDAGVHGIHLGEDVQIVDGLTTIGQPVYSVANGTV